MLTGGAGADTITGGAGADTLNGGAGIDTFVATVGDGNDAYVGGGGQGDTYDLSGTATAATVNLPPGNSNSADTGNDTLATIERVVGSSAGDIADRQRRGQHAGRRRRQRHHQRRWRERPHQWRRRQRHPERG